MCFLAFSECLNVVVNRIRSICPFGYARGAVLWTCFLLFVCPLEGQGTNDSTELSVDPVVGESAVWIRVSVNEETSRDAWSLQSSRDLVSWSNNDNLAQEESDYLSGRTYYKASVPFEGGLDSLFFRVLGQDGRAASVDCSDCDYVLENGEFFLDNDTLNLPAGSRIGIRAGDRTRIDIRNFQGTESAPYTFVNCGGQVRLNLSSSIEAIRVRNSSHLRITGTGSSEFYGIKIEAGSHGVHAYEKTDRIEIDHLEISGVGIGVWVVTRPQCDGESNQDTYHQEDIIVHNNYIHDVHGEGMYIGGSKWGSEYNNNDCPEVRLLQPYLTNVRVYDNLVERIGWDGIQVGGAIGGCEIFNNVVRDYGLRETTVHQAGLMVNPGSTGEIFANTIEGGTGNAIFLLGFDNLVYSNLVVDCAQNAVHIGDRNPLPGKSYRIVNNTFINIERRALYFNSSQSVESVFYNNFLSNIGDSPFYFVADNIDIDNNMVTESLDGYGFEDVANLDFSPGPESPLIDAGRNYQRDHVRFDRLMRPRFVGTKLDVGAFERPQ